MSVSKVGMAVAAFATLGMAACTTTQERVSGAGAGALAGAAVGGPVGAAVGGVGGAVAAPTVSRSVGVKQAAPKRTRTQPVESAPQ